METSFERSTAGISIETYFIRNIYQLFGLWYNKLDVEVCGQSKIKTNADRQHLQHDLNKLTKWSEKWKIPFNFVKCKCLHTEHVSECAQYTMGGTELNTTLKERDLELTISADRKVSEQCGIAAKKGNQISVV